jgi:hypothetical protein
MDDRGSRVRFPVGAGNFSLHHRVQNGSGAHPASYQMGTRGSVSLWVKQPSCEADHSPPSSGEIKEWLELYLHPKYVFMEWCLVKHRDSFTFTFSSVGIALATSWTIGVLGFDSRWGLGLSLFTIVSRTAMRPTQPPIKWVSGALSLAVKRPGREADHSPPPIVEVKNVWSYTSIPH